MLQCYHKYFILNNKTINSSEFNHELFEQGVSVYEVIRIINTRPLFYQEHIDRLIKTSNILNFPVWTDNENIKKNVKRLIDLNEVKTGNIEIIFNVNNKKERNFILLFIEDRYPTQQAYEKGIPSVFFQAEREIPNAKRITLLFRKKTVDVIRQHQVYDVILVNRSGQITEGSRSNIFFIDNNKVVTPPVQDILPGITRDKIFGICRKYDISLTEQIILKNSIDKYQAAFFSGTSPKVLPISAINNIKYNVQHPLMRKIMHLYDDMITEYINHSEF